MADGERLPAGMHEQTKPEPVSSPDAWRRLRGHSLRELQTLRTQILERARIRRRQRPNDEIDDGNDRKHFDPYDFAEASFHEVPLHRGMTVSWHDNANASGTQKGSEPPSLELRGADSLPFFAYRLELFLPRQPRSGWKAATVRRRRTSTAALL